MSLEKRAVVIGLILMIVFLITISIACEPFFNLVIENQTSQNLTIYLDKERIGNVEPGKTITKNEIPGASIEYSVVAKNSQGEVIFSKTLTRSDMQYLGNDTFKVVIPPLQQRTEISDNVTEVQ